MSIRNTSLVPFKLTSIPDRYTAVYVADQTKVTASAGTGATTRLNRLQGGTFSMSTKVDDVVEMGATYRPGGIDNLGEIKWSLTWNAVGIGNLAALTGQTVPTNPGSSLTIGQTQINAATVDFFRLVGDAQGNIFGTLYMPDCIIDDYGVDAKESGMITENASGRGPAAVFFPGFIVPKTYLATATDVTNGYLSVGSILGADESIVQIFLPNQGAPPSYFQQNGASYFLKIEKVPGANLANPTTRYFEHEVNTFQSPVTAPTTTYTTPSGFAIDTCQVGQQVSLGLGTANAEIVTITAVAQAVNTNSGSSTVASAGSATITPASMAGIEVGVTLHCVNTAGTNSENVQVTAITTTTFTATFASTKTAGFLITTAAPSFQATFAKTHAIGDSICGALSATSNYQGNAAFIATGNKLFLGEAITAGDLFRLHIMTYNTDSFPTAIPNSSPDTTDRAAVAARLVPLKINAATTNRVQSASYKMSLKRDHVNGLGETKNVYGISSVPDVAVDFDVKETDLSLLSQLQTGSKNLTTQGGTIQNDFEDLNYLTRVQLNASTAVPSSISLFDPFDASKLLCTWSLPQMVVESIDYASSNKSDNTVKVKAMDIQGNLSVTYTVNN